MATPFTRFLAFLFDGGKDLSVIQSANAWPLLPQDGQGLIPLLRHPGMIWHPPALYLGYVGFIIPFSLANAALITKRRDGGWIEQSRPWTLFSRVVLTLFSNLVLLSILMVCFLGPLFPDLFTGTEVTVGPTWYERIIGPLFLLLLFLMAFCPISAWSASRLAKSLKQLIFAAPLSLMVPLLTWIFGEIRDVYALIALWLAGWGVWSLLAT